MPDRVHDFFFFPRIIKQSCLRKSYFMFLTESACFLQFFFDRIFPLSPLSIQEMLTGQRLCQSSSHNDAVLAALNQQRSDGILCDVTLIAEEQKFHAHKAVLAACSDYFRVSPNIFFFSYNDIKIYPGGGGRDGYRYHTEQALNLSLYKIHNYCTFSIQL